MGAANEDQQRAGASASALCHCNAHERTDLPRCRLTLRPHRSLGQLGQARVLLFVGLGLAMPILPLALMGVAGFMLVFAIAAIAALGLAFRHNMRASQLREDIAIWPDLMAVTRQDPNGALRHWCAHPDAVRLHLSAKGPPEHYLTVDGGPRRIELGAFLTPEDRIALHDRLQTALRFAGLPD